MAAWGKGEVYKGREGLAWWVERGTGLGLRVSHGH